MLALFAVGIGCSWATTALPRGNRHALPQIGVKYFVQFTNFDKFIGCGDAFLQAAYAMKPRLNSEGQGIIDQFKEGIKQLRQLIVIGDVSGQASNLRDIGAVGMRKLATTTSDECLQGVFLHLAYKDEQVAGQISGRDPQTSANAVCNLLNYKAQRIQRCLNCQ